MAISPVPGDIIYLIFMSLDNIGDCLHLARSWVVSRMVWCLRSAPAANPEICYCEKSMLALAYLHSWPIFYKDAIADPSVWHSVMSFRRPLSTSRLPSCMKITSRSSLIIGQWWLKNASKQTVWDISSQELSSYFMSWSSGREVLRTHRG